MATLRAPSLDLLRALRSSVKPQTLNLRCRTKPRTLILTSQFSTTPSHHNTSSKPPSTTTTVTNTSAQSQRLNPRAPATHDRGPASKEDTQTDFGVMDIFHGTPEPATSVDACTPDGFHLNNGVKVTNAAVLLAGGEAWAWRPWLALSPPNAPTPKISDMLDPRRGTLVFPELSLSILAHLHPKPDLLLIGTGSKTWALEPITRKYIMEVLGCRVDIMSTENATAAYNLLAKERGAEGGSGVGGLFLPIGWRGPEGAGRRR